MSNHLAVAVAIVINAHKFPAQITQELVRFASTTLSQPQRSVRNKKIISQKTIEARLYGVCASINTLIDLKFAVKTLDNVGEKHIAALHAAWSEAGGRHEKSAGRIHNLNCYLRLLFDIHLGKHGLVKAVSFYDAECKRTYAAVDDKSWSGQEVDAETVIGRIAANGGDHQIAAAQLELCLAFGLRVSEAWLARPLELLDDAIGRETVRIQHGTKGGRPRDMPLSELIQIEVLARVAAFARGQHQTMIPIRYTLPQWRSRYYTIVRSFGLKRDDTGGALGVTSHGLRHQYLHAVYKRLTGSDAPIKGATTIDLDTHRAALKTLIEHAGHSGIRKASAYLGSPTLIRKLDRLKAAIDASETAKSEVPPQAPPPLPSDNQAREAA
jgi:integrase